MAIVFKGLPPHDLAPARSVAAHPRGRNVEVTLWVPDDWHPPTSIAVRVEMSPAVARDLAAVLTAAATQVESGGQRDYAP
jgi:hypothetical protein